MNVKPEILPIFIFLLLFSGGCNKSVKVSPRQKILFDFAWHFHRGDVENGENPQFDDTDWRQVNLPHDWSIEDLTGTNSPFDSTAIGGTDAGYLVGGTGWYRKTFEIPEHFRNKKLALQFGGVYMNADVWLNGVHLGNHPYGYTAFELDITDKAKIGETNLLAVQVKNEGRNSRWYSGSGIYRHVWLKVTELVHIKTWGVAMTTPEVSDEKALVNVQTQIENETAEVKPVTSVIRILDGDGYEMTTTKNSVEIAANNQIKINQSVEIQNPKLWSTEKPNLYTAVVEIQDEKGIILDITKEQFGIRTLEFTVDKGFLLNGRPMLLKGGCIHHDNGPLGAAAYDRAEERRVELMKANGFNAIRCAHNPPSEAFLNACDRLGMLVIDEAFDMWRKPKNPQDYSNYFDGWWQKDVAAMVLRDRNHPSVIMWSIGNEIPERGRPEGVETAKMLVSFVKNLDTTRLVTSAVNGLGPDKDPYFATLDISGYNYSYGGDHGQKSIFEKDHERVPNRIMYCSESYPLEAFGAWMDAEKYPYVLGDFVWTGFDYLGEASIGWRGYPHDENFYPWNHAFCGDIDICGFKRPQSYYRDVIWGVGQQLSIFVKPPQPSFPVKKNRADWSKWHWHDAVAEWNWEGYENQSLEVNVYSGYETVELFLNGKSLGKKATNTTNQFIATWDVPYQPGELKAVGYNGGQIKATQILQTAEEPVQIKLTADRQDLKATAQDLCYVTVELLDKNGVRNPETDNLVNFEVQGTGEIVAVGSSNPMSVESFQQPHRKAWKGRCLVVLKSGKEPGEIVLKATSEGLPESQITVNVNN
jgi:beta-galactosidase